MTSKAKPVSLFDGAIMRQAVGESFRKLSPRAVAKNPVMFVVEVGSALTTLLVVRDLIVRAADHPPALVHRRRLGVALVHRALRQLRRGGRRGAWKGAGRDPPQDAQGDDGPAAHRRQVRRERGRGSFVVAAQGRPGGRRGEPAGPGRRRDCRRDRLGRRVGHHGRVGARHPRERRRSLGGDRRHQGALGPHRGPHRQRSRRIVPRSHDSARRGGPRARRPPTRSRSTSCWSG